MAIVRGDKESFDGRSLATGWLKAHDGTMLIFSLLQGLSAGLRLQESPLYRYPYRNAREAFRGDAKRVGNDIEAVMERIYE